MGKGSQRRLKIVTRDSNCTKQDWGQGAVLSNTGNESIWLKANRTAYTCNLVDEIVSYKILLYVYMNKVNKMI